MCKKTLLIWMLLLLICLLPAARKDKNRPAWVDNPSSEYNDLLYLSAVGIGSARNSAEDNARANLSKIFASTITTESGFEQRYEELISESDTKFSTSTNQTDRVQVFSSQKLSNIQIGKSWTDKMGQVYAIAFLHRSSTAELYLQRISDNNKRIMSLLMQGLETEDLWSNFAILSAAGIVNSVNLDMIEQLKIISLSDASDLKLPYDPEILKAQINSAGQKISFRIETEGEDAKALSPVLETVINTIGFSLSDTGSNSIRLRYNLEELVMDNPQKYIRYQLAIAVADESGNQIISHNEAGREAHFTYEEAKARALRSVSSKIRADFSKKMQDFLDTKISSR